MVTFPAFSSTKSRFFHWKICEPLRRHSSALRETAFRRDALSSAAARRCGAQRRRKQIFPCFRPVPPPRGWRSWKNTCCAATSSRRNCALGSLLSRFVMGPREFPASARPRRKSREAQAVEPGNGQRVDVHDSAKTDRSHPEKRRRAWPERKSRLPEPPLPRCRERF